MVERGSDAGESDVLVRSLTQAAKSQARRSSAAFSGYSWIPIIVDNSKSREPGLAVNKTPKPQVTLLQRLQTPKFHYATEHLRSGPSGGVFNA